MVKKEHMPGGPIDSSQLYNIKIGEGNRQLGVTDLRGEWQNFDNGETIEFIRVEGVKDRVAVIKLQDGTKLPYETWATRSKS